MPPSLQNTSSTLDGCLSKAIRPLVVLSLAVHLLWLVWNASHNPSTDAWFAISSMIAQNQEDLPLLHQASWGQPASNVENLNNATSTTMIRPTITATTKMLSSHLNYNSSADVRAPRTTHRIPLQELVNSNLNVTCKPGKSKKYLIQSSYNTSSPKYSNTTFNTTTFNRTEGRIRRQIPNTVHVTSKTRCMTPTFIRNIHQWRFPGYTLYVHDDVAVDRLLAKYWPEFPQLQLLQKCTISGAAKADIWRLLVLWEYGGIYIDNAPGPMFDEGRVIQEDDDAWFVVERIGILSQYFMAASPKHPLIYVALTTLFQRLLAVDNIRKQYVPHVTGPGTIKDAMILFMKDKSFETVKKGKYVGIGRRSVTVEGARGRSHIYVIRESVQGIHKKGGYAAMGMVHFSKKQGTAPSSSCYEHLYMESKKLLDLQSLPPPAE